MKIAVLGILLTCGLWSPGQAQKKAPDSPPAPSAPDSAATADATASTSDSTRAHDPAMEWQRWKDLDRATRLRPLDGPGDIIEKSEIVQDRVDDLVDERQRLTELVADWEGRRQALETQLEVLDDLARVHRGGDLQLQQRLHNIREGGRLAARRQVVLGRSLEQLASEIERLQKVFEDYEGKAEELRRRERETR
jgi:hypothetical protein